jgi:selenocysteine lyase/cysteine desulfurase
MAELQKASPPGATAPGIRRSARAEPVLDAGLHFAVEPGYLDTASVGAPPEATMEAMRSALAEWASGRARPQDYDPLVAAARAAFARLVQAEVQDVCVGSQVSALAGLVAASLPDGAEVVAVEGDFTSILFPFLAQADRGVDVSLVALGELAGAIGPRTCLAVLSAVQSATGEIADLDAVERAASEHGALTFVDATQACGWLALDASRFDYLACAAYKWLLSPRGTAFMAVRPDRLEELRPNAAGWYAGEDVWSSIYGGPLRLAATARRLDVSPAWLSWVGTVPSLEIIERIGVEAIGAHDVGLANRVREGLGMPAGASAIVRIEAPIAAERLAAAGIRASVRAGAARLSFHLHNTQADVDRALEALTARR